MVTEYSSREQDLQGREQAKRARAKEGFANSVKALAGVAVVGSGLGYSFFKGIVQPALANTDIHTNLAALGAGISTAVGNRIILSIVHSSSTKSKNTRSAFCGIVASAVVFAAGIDMENKQTHFRENVIAIKKDTARVDKLPTVAADQTISQAELCAAAPVRSYDTKGKPYIVLARGKVACPAPK